MTNRWTAAVAAALMIAAPLLAGAALVAPAARADVACSPQYPWPDEATLAADCNQRAMRIANPGYGVLMTRGTGGPSDLVLPDRNDFYVSQGVHQGFLWWAPESDVTISKSDKTTQWTHCDPHFSTDDPGTTCTGDIKHTTVSDNFTADVTLHVFGFKGEPMWIAKSCGNYPTPPPDRPVRRVIRLIKFDDRNQNGVRDDGEPGMAGFTFHLSRVSSLVRQAPGDIADLTTGPDGTATFDLGDTDGPGTYQLTEAQQDGWTSTTGLSQTFDVGFGGGDTVADVASFGNTPAIGISKTAAGGFTRSYQWGVSKDVDKTLWKQVGGAATFTYTVTATHDAGTDSGWHASGVISVTNRDPFPHTGVTVTDALDDPSGQCAVQGGDGATLPAAPDPQHPTTTDFPYTCTYPAHPQAQQTNHATVTWPSVYPAGGTTSQTTSVDFAFPQEPTTLVDDCAHLVDQLDAGSPVVNDTCVADVDAAGASTFTYSRSIPMPAYECVDHTNVVTLTANTTGTSGSASKTVTTCGPGKTGAATIGFWRNKNGAAIITGQAATGACPSAAWMRQYAPFQDLSATATCAKVDSYVNGVIDSANASGASMNAMLKAQGLATALDIYFSNPALGGNKIGAPAPIAGVVIDLSKVCANPLSCSTYLDLRSFFGGPSITAGALLNAVAAHSNAGGTVWYGQVKSTQELAKDALDAINNQVVFRYP
jgi:hypothetical protein